MYFVIVNDDWRLPFPLSKEDAYETAREERVRGVVRVYKVTEVAYFPYFPEGKWTE